MKLHVMESYIHSEPKWGAWLHSAQPHTAEDGESEFSHTFQTLPVNVKLFQ